MITCQFENGTTAALRHVVVHALVVQDGKLLLVKRGEGMLEGGKWGLPGGFLDRNETISQAVLRELREETGWEGEVVSLLQINSLPDRPHEDRQNVAFDFIVKPLRQTGKPDAESSAVAWVPLTDVLPLSEYAFDHGESIALFLKYQKESFLLPYLR